MRHDELDSQLPWIQIHRSVGAKAASLAARVGADYFRVRGILEAFWESLADRRVLAKAIAGPGCVVLDRQEVESRLCRLISPACTPEDVQAAGFLEPFQDERDTTRAAFFRVRGMSRYLGAEKTRQARRGGAVGVQPHSDPPSTPLRPPTTPPRDGGATPQRREERGERRDIEAAAAAGTRPATPILVPDLPLPELLLEERGNSGEAYFAFIQGERRESGYVNEAAPHPSKLAGWFSEAMLELQGDVTALDEAYMGFAKDPYWLRQKLPFRGFMAQWRKFAPRIERPPPTPPGPRLEAFDESLAEVAL